MDSEESTAYYSQLSHLISSQALVPKISLFVPAPLILLPWYANHDMGLLDSPRAVCRT